MVTGPCRRMAVQSGQWICCIVPLLLAADTAAGAPRVVFDTATTVKCRDITTAESAETHRHEKLVEATFRVSARIVQGKERELTELWVEIVSLDKTMRVASYLPHTTLETDIVGYIKVEQTEEKNKKAHLGVRGEVEIPATDAEIEPSAEIGNSRHTIETRTILRKPIKSPVIISGTMFHEHGVFYKMKPSLQTSLEGMHEFTCRFYVPKEWREGKIRIKAIAKGVRQHFFSKSIDTVGQTRILASLYLPDAEHAESSFAPRPEQVARLAEKQKGETAGIQNWFLSQVSFSFPKWLAEQGRIFLR